MVRSRCDCYKLNLPLDTFDLPKIERLCIQSSSEPSAGEVVMISVNLKCTVQNFCLYKLFLHLVKESKNTGLRYGLESYTQVYPSLPNGLGHMLLVLSRPPLSICNNGILLTSEYCSKYKSLTHTGV